MSDARHFFQELPRRAKDPGHANLEGLIFLSLAKCIKTLQLVRQKIFFATLRSLPVFLISLRSVRDEQKYPAEGDCGAGCGAKRDVLFMDCHREGDNHDRQQRDDRSHDANLCELHCP